MLRSKGWTLLLGLMVLISVSCDDPCENANVGSSSVNHSLTSDWPYGDGTAAGTWDLTLTPDANSTNCVLVSDNQYLPETYVYGLEFPDETSESITNVYIDGVLFAEGDYEDSEGESPDRVVYETGERLDETRPEGKILYYIQGEATLEANRHAGRLTWTGFESIVVLDSEDPEISVGCTFTYDVSGAKLCDE